MSPTLTAIARMLHILAFSTALGASVAAWFIHRRAITETAPDKSGMEGAAAGIITLLELPALFAAMFAGILLIVAYPNVFDPKTSGAGPWIHIKLTGVMALLVVDLRMFRSRALVRERKSGASEADCEALASKARLLGSVDVALFIVVVALATLRFVLFGGQS